MMNLIEILSTAILFTTLLYLYRKWHISKVRASYTACSSPNCVRCSKYSLARTRAREKLKTFEKKCGSKLSRLIDATDRSTKYQHKSQKPNVLYVSGLQDSPWWQKSSFGDDVNKLESNWRLIFDEFLNIYKGDSLLESHWTSNTTEKGSWRTFYLYNQGQEVPGNCSLCPKTYQLLGCLENFMSGCVFGNALFSVLEPHTTIAEHYGPTNTRIRCHLGLKIPEGCELTVNGDARSWITGKCIIFDDSFIHSVRHTGVSVSPRVIFMLDFWHPDLKLVEKKAILYAFGANFV